MKSAIFWDIRPCSTLKVNFNVDFQRTTRSYIPEDSTLHNHPCENLRSYIIIIIIIIIIIHLFRRKCLKININIPLYTDQSDCTVLNVGILSLNFIQYMEDMKNSIFWDITPCRPLKVNRRFGGTCYLHPQDRRWAKQDTGMKQVAGMEETYCIETSVDFRRTTRRYKLQDRTLHNHRCENLKSCTGDIFRLSLFSVDSVPSVVQEAPPTVLRLIVS
jgi:hypothetical protein